MLTRELSRIKVLQGGAALAALATFRLHGSASASTRQPTAAAVAAAQRALATRQAALAALDFPVRDGEETLPWLDQPAANPVPDVVSTQLVWEALDSWIIPNDKFFTVKHYNQPAIDPATWSMDLSGLVGKPLTITLADLKSRPRQEVTFTLECSGNTGLPFLWGAIGNAVWAGTPLAPLLQELNIQPEGIEVVFWGTDTGTENVRDMNVTEQFARSMSLADAMD